MNKFAIALLTAAMTLGSGAALAASGDNNGTANQAADAGAASGGSEQTMAPNNVSNSKINEGSHNSAGGTTHQKMKHHKKMTADQIDKNTQCKDGKCPDINKKVGPGADTKTDGTTQ